MRDLKWWLRYAGAVIAALWHFAMTLAVIIGLFVIFLHVL